MKKTEFLEELRKALIGFPKEEVDGRIAFFAEMIDDRIEDAMSEDDAVKDIGTVEEITKQIISEIPLSKLVKQKIKSNSHSALSVTLISFGAVVWLPVLISLLASAFAIYVSLLSIVISLWACVAALGVCGVGGVLLSPVLPFLGQGNTALLILSASLLSLGTAVFIFFASVHLTRLTLRLGAWCLYAIKRCFAKNRE